MSSAEPIENTFSGPKRQLIAPEKLQALIDAERVIYKQRNKTSYELYTRDNALLGGVPMTWMRKWHGGFPIFYKTAHGNQVTDVGTRPNPVRLPWPRTHCPLWPVFWRVGPGRPHAQTATSTSTSVWVTPAPWQAIHPLPRSRLCMSGEGCAWCPPCRDLCLKPRCAAVQSCNSGRCNHHDAHRGRCLGGQ